MLCGAGQLGTVMVGKNMVGYRREKKAERHSCPTERDGSEEAKTVKNKLMWEACLPPRDMVFFWSWAAPHGDVHAPVTTDSCGMPRSGAYTCGHIGA